MTAHLPHLVSVIGSVFWESFLAHVLYTWLQRLGRHEKEDTHPYIVLHNPLSHFIDQVFMSVANVGMIGDGDGEHMQVPLGSKGGRLWLARAPLVPPPESPLP